MEYAMEDLMPVLIWLTEKYTAKESTSVTYERAQILMKAVIYCIDENYTDIRHSIRNRGETNLQVLYQRGYELVIAKVYQAKKVYNEIIEEFEDYRCRAYRETIIDGMPAFFRKYDPKFNPQGHLLTLDYPAIQTWPDLTGVDLILEYLQSIRLEQKLMNLFERKRIMDLLERTVPEYEELYLDNICHLVLFQAIGCMITGRPVRDLCLPERDYPLIRRYFTGDSKEEVKGRVFQMTKILCSGANIKNSCFVNAATDFSIRLGNI